MAKLTLWSPFAGVLLLALLGETFGNGDEAEPRNMVVVCGVCSLFFAGGLALGWKALRAMKVEGRKGIYGRTLTGMALDGFLLGLMLFLMCFGIYVLNLKARMKEQQAFDEQKIKEMFALRDTASTDFGLKAKEWEKKYRSAGKALIDAHVLDMASVKGREDLNLREQVAGDFIAASKGLQELAEHGAEIYEQELIKRNVPRGLREASVKVFSRTFFTKSFPNLASRQAEVRWGEAMLKVFTFLDDTWGQWKYLPATEQLEFEDERKNLEYNALAKELSEASKESNKLRQQAPHP
jgi:hypothetical protein